MYMYTLTKYCLKSSCYYILAAALLRINSSNNNSNNNYSNITTKCGSIKIASVDEHPSRNHDTSTKEKQKKMRMAKEGMSKGEMCACDGGVVKRCFPITSKKGSKAVFSKSE